MYVRKWGTLMFGGSHIQERGTFRFISVHKSSSKIDFFFVLRSNLNLRTSCSIGNNIISDHSPIFLQLLHKEGTPLLGCGDSTLPCLVNLTLSCFTLSSVYFMQLTIHLMCPLQLSGKQTRHMPEA